MAKLKAPFPYFGGKSKMASLIWKALGNPKHYIEPFFGSGAVLLARERFNPAETIETICDKDGFLANVWRSLQQCPDEVAKWCDWPVNHVDLNARRRRLLAEEPALLKNLAENDEYCNPKLAGYWVWAASCWIGSGLTRLNAIPSISSSGKGVHAIGQIPHISSSGMGVHAIGQIPHISSSGMGVHAIGHIPHISDSGMGVHDPYNTNIYKLFRQLSERLRYARVVCGDWTRVCGGKWQDKAGDVGIFFDPPYGVKDRDLFLYRHDSSTIAADVMAWCKERGNIPSYRIVLAGYEEYQELIENYGWKAQVWQSNGGYANTSTNKTRGDDNKKRECLYFSPYCVKQLQQGELFK